MEDDILLKINDLSVEFRIYDGVVKAVNKLNLEIPKKTTIGIVGETGAGKTTTALSIMKLVQTPPGFTTSGDILFKGKDILRMGKKEINSIRGNEISMIFQNPMTSLNPLLTAGNQILGVIKQHNNISDDEARKRANEMLNIVGIPSERFSSYPFELSGGMRQRICIAMGLACNPELLIADEPTTALDVTIQAQILDLMKDLKERYDTSIIFITHDLGVIREIADYVLIMYAGNVIEEGDIKAIYTDPRHPYTKGLFGCLPILDEDTDELNLIPGEMPDPMNLPKGCKFNERCDIAGSECYENEPKLLKISEKHFVKCLKPDYGGENLERTINKG